MWTSRHGEQLGDLKQALISAPVLATLVPEGDFILRTDASDTAIGGVMAQKQLFEGRLVERPLGYFSRKLHAVESRYPAYDRELLAISANLEHRACYVHGRKRTTIYTDHASLQHILAQNKLTSHQWRHLDRLQQHDYEVKYFPGAANVVADCYTLNTTGSEFGHGPGRKVLEIRHTVLGRHPETGQPTLSGLGSGQLTLRHQKVPGPSTGADRESASAAAEEDNLGGHHKKDKQSEGNGNARN